MEITWLGQSCFRIKGKNATVITDPFGPDSGYTLGKHNAGIVTVSHLHADHAYSQGISGEPRVLYRPGEYEIAGVLVIGIPSFHDAESGAKLGKNNIFLFEIDEVTICHLGDLGHNLTAGQIEEMGNIDVLLVPVGGVTTIDAAIAAQLVRQVEPKVVLPMHYKTPASTMELETVDRFLKEMGVSQLAPQPKLSVTKSNLPLTMQVVLLTYS